MCVYLRECESHSVMSNSLRPHGLYGPWNFPGQNTGEGSHSPLQGIFPTQGSTPSLPHCRQILYQPGKSKNTGVDSLSLLQRIFPTQEWNWGLLHCRRILYQQRYRGSPSQHTRGQSNLCPWNVCGGGHVHSRDLPHSQGTTQPIIMNHTCFCKCAFPPIFLFGGTYKSIILKCPVQLCALPDKHLSCKFHYGCCLLSQVALIYLY